MEKEERQKQNNPISSQLKCKIIIMHSVDADKNNQKKTSFT